MNIGKKLLLISLAVIALGFCLRFFATRIFTPKTLVVDVAQNQNSKSQSSSDEELSVVDGDPTQNSDAESEQQNSSQEKEPPSQDPADNSADVLEDKSPSQKKEAPSFIKKELISWGFQKSQSRNSDTIIIHSSYDALGDDPYDVNGVLDEFKQYGVSAHYLIDRKGTVHQLVENENIAYHAGVSSVPDGRTNVNLFSIGIELMNTKDDEYTDAQYKSLNKLLDYLKNNYSIKYVLGHKDIAPGRKDDPWNFNWDEIE